jgi:Bacteriophage baseplate protein W
MSTRRYRAWHFLHPDLDDEAGGNGDPRASKPDPGLQLSPTGGVAMVDESASVRQAILLLFSTAPGERVMRPDYGVPLQRLVFSPNDDTTAGLAIHYVKQALDRWEPRITVLELDAVRDESDSARLTISLTYRLRTTAETHALAFSINLQGD